MSTCYDNGCALHRLSRSVIRQGCFPLNIMAIHVLFGSLLIVEHSVDSGQWTVDPGPPGSA